MGWGRSLLLRAVAAIAALATGQCRSFEDAPAVPDGGTDAAVASDSGSDSGSPKPGAALPNCDPSIPTGKRVFVADGYKNGGGIEAADKACMDSAVTAGLCGQYVAWMSDSNINAIDRVPRDVPFVVVKNGAVAKVGPSREAVAQGLVTSINANASGAMSPFSEVWTGTLVGGGKADQNCGDWKTSNGSAVGVSGTVTQTSAKWTESGQPICSKVLSVVCFEL